MNALLQELKGAMRSLSRTPAFAATTIAIMALCSVAATTSFSVVDGLLLRSLPFAASDRLIDIKLRRPHGGASGGTSPISAYDLWKTGSTRALVDAAAYSGGVAVLSGNGPAQDLTIWTTSASFFHVLGVRPIIGRFFAADEDRAGSDPVLVISYDYWRTRIGGDSSIVGRVVMLDSRPYTVIGVASPAFRYPENADGWRNLGAYLGGPDGARHAQQSSFWVLGRLREGSSIEEAQAELTNVTQKSWNTTPALDQSTPVVTLLQAFLVKGVRSSLLLLTIAVILVLLAGCANIGGLLLARGTDREHEMAVRSALGASPSRLMTFVFAESILISLMGGAVGTVGAVWAVRGAVLLAAGNLPRVREIAVDFRVLAMAVASSVAAGLLAGAIPAFRVWKRRLRHGLTLQSAGTTRRDLGRTADLLVAVQVAITIVLLTAGAALARSFLALTELKEGFDPSKVVYVSVHLPGAQFPTPASILAYANAVHDRLAMLPEASSVAVSSGMPFDGGSISSIARPGIQAPDDQPWAWIAATSPEYLKTLSIPSANGGGAPQPGTVLIDSAALRAYFPGEDPLGKALVIGGGAPRMVAGIVGNTRQVSLNDRPPPHVYTSLIDDPSAQLKVLVQVRGDPHKAVSIVVNAMRTVSADVPIGRAGALSDRIAESLYTRSLYLWIEGALATIALLLAAAGIYGVAAYTVTRRRREIGIRRALGAANTSVLKLIVARRLTVTGIGIALGIAGSILASRTLKQFLFETSALDPVVLIWVIGTLVAATLIATYRPASKALEVDPMSVLKAE